jgi:hypothetical protein
VSGI